MKSVMVYADGEEEGKIGFPVKDRSLRERRRIVPRRPIVLLSFVLLYLMGQIAQVSSTEPASPDKVFYQDKRAFNIPFSVRHSPGRIVEFRLFASENGGPWVMVSQGRPAQGRPEKEKILYRGDRDGPFAFAVQLLREGNIFDPPTKELQVGMRVVIDTQPPRATIRAKVESDGSAGVEWDVVDENLDKNSVVLEYRWPEQAEWLPFDPKAAYKPRDSMSWELKSGQKLEVRIRAKDLAGNKVTSAAVWTPPQVGGNNFIDPMKEEPGPLNPSRSTLFYRKTRQVKLDFDVQVGPSGLAVLELYYQGFGTDWKLYEKKKEFAIDDPERLTTSQSLTFEATGDGLYGFIIVAKNHAGVGGSAPKKGDLPRIEMICDTTPPTLTMKQPTVRSNGDRGAFVDIEWVAKDANLAPQPINIYYSPDPKKEEWKLVADRLENNGKFTWNVDTSSVPFQFYIKVTALDRADNSSEVITEKKVIVDLTVPSIDIKQIKEITPNGGSGTGNIRISPER
jgi:hypothetical protein